MVSMGSLAFDVVIAFFFCTHSAYIHNKADSDKLFYKHIFALFFISPNLSPKQSSKVNVQRFLFRVWS